MGKSLLALCVTVLVALSVNGQTSSDLAAKYPAVSAHEVRPGILMTVEYAEDGQVCELTIEKRHSKSKDKDIDLASAIPSKLIDELTDELAPAAERGPATSRYLSNESYVAGGVLDIKRDFENVYIREVGSTSQSCNGGTEVVIIHWKKRACAAGVIAKATR
jgi:hypothetical protein